MAENQISDDEYFDDSNKKGASSALLKSEGDFVQGEIVRFAQRDKTKFGTNEVETNEDGSPRKQMVIILQTEYRNWDKVAKVPTAKDGSPRPVEEDEGLRAIYVPRYTNIYQALGDAIHDAGEKRIAVGGWFGVKITKLEDTGKGNPLKVHAAKYRAPEPVEAASEDDPFGEFEAPAAGKALKDDKSLTADAKTEAKETAKDEAKEAQKGTPVEEPPF